MKQRAKLCADIYYIDPKSVNTATKRLPAGTSGNVEECHCAYSAIEYHFYPDDLDGLMVGVMAKELDFGKEAE